jgi:hypothetical protein
VKRWIRKYKHNDYEKLAVVKEENQKYVPWDPNI